MAHIVILSGSVEIIPLPIRPSYPSQRRWEPFENPSSGEAGEVFSFEFHPFIPGLSGAPSRGKAMIVRDADDPFVVDSKMIVPEELLQRMGLIVVHPNLRAGHRSMLRDLVALSDAGRSELVDRLRESYVLICQWASAPQSVGASVLWARKDIACAKAVLKVYEDGRARFRAAKKDRELLKKELRLRQLLNQAMCWGVIELRGDELWLNFPMGHTFYRDGLEELICVVQL